MNLFNGEKLGRKYIGLITLFVGLFVAWIITNSIKSFGMFGTIADYLFKGYATFCAGNTISKVPGMIRDFREKKNGSQKGVQVDQTGSPDRGRDSRSDPADEGDDVYSEGDPGEGEP